MSNRTAVAATELYVLFSFCHHSPKTIRVATSAALTMEGDAPVSSVNNQAATKSSKGTRWLSHFLFRSGATILCSKPKSNAMCIPLMAMI